MADFLENERAYTTSRSAQELARLLQASVTKTGAKVEDIVSDSFSLPSDDDIEAVVQVVSSGNTFQALHGGRYAVGDRTWVVQFYIYDLDDRRIVSTIALGDSFVGSVAQSFFGVSSVNFKDSIRIRDMIIDMMQAGDQTVREGVIVDDPPEGITFSKEVISSAPPKSVLFSKMISQTGTVRNLSQVELENETIRLLGAACEKFATENPNFPAHNELMYVKARSVKKDSEEYYVLKPYLDYFPETSTPISDLAEAFLEDNIVDCTRTLIYAGLHFYAENDNTANLNLKDVLAMQLNGYQLKEEEEKLWLYLAWSCNFGKWYLDNPLEEDSPAIPETSTSTYTPETPPPITAEAAPPITAETIQSSSPAPSGGSMMASGPVLLKTTPIVHETPSKNVPKYETKSTEEKPAKKAVVKVKVRKK